jgi:O-antigen ligase
MLSFRRLVTQDPLSIIATFWPLVLLAPLVPGLPQPATNSLPWRQEIVLALLLSTALVLLARRAIKTGAWTSTLRRTELLTLLPVALFFFWSAASLLWAVSLAPALHHTFVWGAYLLFFLLLCRAARRPKLLRSSITTLGLVICIIGISSSIEYWCAPVLLIRASTGLGEPLAVALPIFTILALTLRRTRAAIFCGVTAVLAWLSVLQSLERAPAIGVGAAMLLLAVAVWIKRQWRPRSLQRVLILLVLFGSAAALQSLPSSATENRPSPLVRLHNTSAEDPNARARFLCWAAGLEMWSTRPLLGVGANNYDTAFPEARAQFAASHAGSGLLAVNEDILVARAHNEYLQILAELGVVGFTLFIVFCVALIIAAWRALRRAQSPLALGGVCSLVVFALSSGASSVSFRWLGSGLIFFFAAALVLHFSADRTRDDKAFNLAPFFMRTAMVTALVFSLLMFGGRGAQATNYVLQGMAQSAASSARTEQLYRQALAWNPFDASTHFNFGTWLFLKGRAPEAVTHLRYAVERGYNASVCYAYLAAAEAGAGLMQQAEQTLAQAVRVYPRSVFLRVRHASALAEVGLTEEANEEYAAALGFDTRAARGWRQLICFGRNAAKTAAFQDKSIAMPGELSPESCIFAVLDENDRRTPVAVLD